MYYEEKVVSGRLAWRTDPRARWTYFTAEELTNKYLSMQDEVVVLRKELRDQEEERGIGS